VAGSYPDVPAPRFAYDRDGSFGVLYFLSGSPGPSSYGPGSATLISANGESNNVFNGFCDTAFFAAVFPDLRDITGAFLYIGEKASGVTASIQTSPDTTTGQDGTWTTRVGPFSATGVGITIATADSPGCVPSYRNNIATLTTITNIKGVRGNINGCNGGIHSFPLHIYGADSSGQNVDSLRAWHPTLNQALGGAALDFGDIARGSTQTKTFRIKNNSAVLTAHQIMVTTEVPTNDASPSLIGQIQVSTDGVNFFNSINIGDLAPGAISGVITVDNDPVAGAAVGLTGPLRINATASFFS
jgi:hypothetical protein